MREEFVIQPNRSLSACGRRVFLWGIGIVMGLITLRLMALGLWLVAPFMLLDLLALVVAFKWVGANCQITERVVIGEKSLRIHHQDTREQKKWQFPLHWVQVDLQTPRHPSHGTRLLIGSHGKWIELAGFLTNEERESLAAAIQRALQVRRASVLSPGLLPGLPSGA